MTDSAKITVGLGRDIQDLVRSAKQSPEFRPKIQPGLAPAGGSVMPFMLLEDVQSGQTAKAVRLTTGTGWSNFLLTATGLKDADAEFQIIWGEETVEAISINSTPAEMLAVFLQFTFLNTGDVRVQFGNHSRSVSSRGTAEDVEEFNTYRWIIKLRPGLEDLELMQPTIVIGEQSWMGVEPTQVEDSGEVVRVQSVMPVGVDLSGASPMQAGAIGLASFVNGIGWVISSLEARNLTGDFTEIPASGIY